MDIINDLSGIKGEFDWEYKISSSISQWRLSKENMDTCIKLTKNGNGFDIETKKTNTITSSSRKVSAMCKSKITKEQAYKMIENYTK